VQEAFALIDQLIKEHKLLLKRFQTAEGIANDAGALLELGKAGEDFVPGRFDDQKQGFQSLKESLEIIDQGLKGHFDREEKGLLTILEKHGSGVLASGLRVLLLEHQELRDRVANSRKDAAELITVSLSREVHGGKAWGVRVYIGHTRKLLEIHARSEQELFHKVRAKLAGA